MCPHANAPPCAFSREEAKDLRLWRARRAELFGVDPYPTKAHCASNTASLRRCTTVFDVQAAVSNEQLEFACAHTRTRHCVLSLSQKEAPHPRLQRARAAPPRLESTCALWKPTAPARRPLSLGARPCFDVPAAASIEQPACSRVRTRERAAARSLWGGGAARAFAANARRASLVGADPRLTEAHCASDTALSLRARPCSDVPAAGSNEQPAFAAHTRTRHRALSVGRRRRMRTCGACAPRRAG